MSKAKQGDKVKVHYTGKLDDDSIFDSSKDRQPLEFVIGEKKVIPGFEKAVIGMEPGESKTIKLNPDEAYGQYRQDMVMEVEKAKLPPNLDPKVGQFLEVKQDNGQVIIVQVTKVDEKNITIDANHPLAGKNLSFDIELIEII
ncbi:peptidylprolyl isomerase [Candidatus Dependentiae bacterium]|nr:peptidylprolyl isomerase [Candidatus Dependentiae bacterium]